MHSLAIASIVLACVFGAAILGLLLQALLPAAHVSGDSKDIVKLGTGMIATLAALVLGLLVSSSKAKLDAANDQIAQVSAKIILANNILIHYGPESTEARETLKKIANGAFKILFSNDTSQISTLDTPEAAARSEVLADKIRALQPKDDRQRALQSRALDAINEMSTLRWTIIVGRYGSVSKPLLVVVIFWLSAIFLSWGLLAPRNSTVVVVWFVCALSVAGAFFLILEMNEPLDGFIRISEAPMRSALAHIGQ